MEEDLLSRINDLRRVGAKVSEALGQLLGNAKIVRELTAHPEYGTLFFEIWSYLLDPRRIKHLLQWEKKHPEKTFSNTFWWEIALAGTQLTQRSALVWIGKERQRFYQAGPLILPLLHSPHFVVREKALYALGKIGPKLMTVVPQEQVCHELSLYLKRDDRSSFDKNKNSFPDFFPKSHEEKKLLQEAIIACGRLAPETKSLIPLLGSRLKKKKHLIPTLNTLGQFKKSAQEVAPKVLNIMTGSEYSEYLKILAADTLVKIAPVYREETLAVLRKIPAIRQHSHYHSEPVYYKPEECIPPLIRVLKGLQISPKDVQSTLDRYQTLLERESPAETRLLTFLQSARNS